MMIFFISLLGLSTCIWMIIVLNKTIENYRKILELEDKYTLLKKRLDEPNCWENAIGKTISYDVPSKYERK